MKFLKLFAAVLCLTTSLGANGALLSAGHFTRPLDRDRQDQVVGTSASGTITVGNSQPSTNAPTPGSAIAIQLYPGLEQLTVNVTTASSWSGSIGFGLALTGTNQTILALTLSNMATNDTKGIGSGATGTWTAQISGGGILYIYGVSGFSGSLVLNVTAAPSSGVSLSTTDGRYVQQNGPQSITTLTGLFPITEDAGTSLVDHSGLGNNGAFVGGSSPTWTTQGLQFNLAGGAYNAINLPAALNSTVTFQIVAVPVAPAFGSGSQPAGVSMGIIAPSSGSNIPMIAGYNPVEGSAGSFNLYLYNHTQVGQTYSAPHVYTFVLGAGGGNDSIWIDGVQVTSYAAQGDTPLLSSGNWMLGGNSAHYMAGTVYYLATYSAALTANQIWSTSQYIAGVMGARGITIGQHLLSTATNQIVAVGDSITEGIGVTNSYATSAVLTGLNDTYTIDKLGQPGITASAVQGYCETQYVTSVASGAAKNIISVFLGTNDAGSNAPATTLANLAAICRTLRAQTVGANTKILVMTMLSRTGVDAFHDSYNTLIRAQWQQFSDGLVDFAANPLYGADGAYANTTYFQADGIHPTQTGQNTLGLMYQTAINAIWNRNYTNPTVTSSATYTMLGGDAFLDMTGSGTATLALVTSVGETGQYRVIRNDRSGTVTVSCQGSETINGSSTYALTAGSSIKIVSVLVSASAGGSNWVTVNGFEGVWLFVGVGALAGNIRKRRMAAKNNYAHAQ
jgi:lysophospholipase L1-like esterase